MKPIECRGRGINLDPGTYFLGDPAQALELAAFDEALEASNDFQRSYIGHGDHALVAFHTRSKERVLCDDEGGSYRVESGLIGLVPAELASARTVPDLAKFGRVVKFDEPVACTRGRDGTLTFGQYRIKTRG